MVLCSFIFIVMALTYQIIQFTLKSFTKKKHDIMKSKLKDKDFRDLQVELYGKSELLRDTLSGSNSSTRETQLYQEFSDDDFA
jgi:predicted RNA-binding protein associated with RNAse of E/G family